MARWLTPDEAAVWTPFVVGSMHLLAVLDRELRREFDISHLDYGFLAQLSFRDDHRARMTELAEAFGVERNIATYRIDRLERQGYVERARCTTDGRGIDALLTPAGEALLERAAPAHVEAVRAHFVDLIEAEDLEPLARTFRTLRDHQVASDDG